MKLTASSIVTLSLGCLFAPQANAETAIFSGMECQKEGWFDYETDGVTYVSRYGATGVSNTRTDSSVRVVCPISYTQAASDLSTDLKFVPNVAGNTIVVNVRDYSPRSSVSCLMGGLSGGGMYMGPASHSCGLFGSCSTDSAPSFTTPLSVYSSVLLVYAVNGTNWISPYVLCTIPPTNNSGIDGASVIQSYRITRNP